MRTLRFIVDGQTVKQDPTCDFSGLFLNKDSSVCAEFIFSSEWNDKIKVTALRQAVALCIGAHITGRMGTGKRPGTVGRNL